MPAKLKLPATGLSRDDRLTIVTQAEALLEQVYVHRHQKEAQHAVNPRQRLRLLRFRAAQTEAGQEGDAWEFHREMVEIFTSLRDLHTSYLLPAPYNQLLAYLPFLVEPCRDRQGERFLVTRLVHAVKAAGFARGVEILHWNGVPIRRAIELNGERQAGGNQSARFARGLQALTMRPLARTLPPDETWVTIGYRTARGKVREAKFDWLMLTMDETRDTTATAASATSGIDWQAALIGRARRSFFQRKRAPAEYLKTELPSIFRAYAIPQSRYGYLRIFSFDVPNADGFLEEVRSLLRRLPAEGLILDVRGNPGGNILAAEQLLQLFTPRRITPAPMQFMNSGAVLALCEAHRESEYVGLALGPWGESVRESVRTGATHSRAFALTPEPVANAVGQEYYGPVVLVTDPLCYSACDMFAAGFQDHGIGEVLGVGGATGAGGANVWHHGLLVDLLPDGPFKPLPRGAGLTVAIRRTLRTGPNEGSLLEEFGVTPAVQYAMTRQDVLGGNDDLIGFAVRRLRQMRPARRLRVREVVMEHGEVAFGLETRGLQRVDAWVDNRPLATWSLGDGARVVRAVSPLASPRHLRLLGYEQDNAAEPVASARVRI